MSHILSPVHMMGRLIDSVDLSAYRLARTETSSQNPQAFSSRLFDVDPDMGFFPTQPYRRLGGDFVLWERELVAARSVLKLGEDHGTEAMAECAKGEQWRQGLRSVSIAFVPEFALFTACTFSGQSSTSSS